MCVDKVMNVASSSFGMKTTKLLYDKRTNMTVGR